MFLLMIKYILNIILLFFLLVFDRPVYPIEYSQKAIDNYNLKISRKFSNTYCNSTKFGISSYSSLKFAIGETNKEFLNNKFNEFIDYEILTENILLSLANNCDVFDFPVYELENLYFKY